MKFNDLKVKLKADFRPLINWYRKKILIKEIYYKNNVKGTNETIFIVDGKLNHGGLSDRFNGIISTYAICKTYNIPFRIKWEYPFTLQDYLIPNKYDWIIKENEIFALNTNSNVVIVLNDPKSKALFKITNQSQNHIYANISILDSIQKKYGIRYEWHALFQELFKPNIILEEKIKEQLKRIKKPYIGIVFRFQQLLGDFKEGNYKTLPNSKQHELLEKCVNSVQRIKAQYPQYHTLVTSDSITFLNRIKEEENVFIIPGKIVHITFSTNENYESYLKSFLDFYMLSKAQKVFSVIAPEMTIDGHLFLTTFPEYAAKAGNVDFERIFL